MLKHAAALSACVWLLVVGRGSQAQDKQGDAIVSDTNTPKNSASKSATVNIASSFYTTSFEMIGDTIVLHVRLNGKVTGNMLLDTGADTLIMPQTAVDLGLKLEPFPEAGPNARSGEIASLTIGSVSLEKVVVEVSSFPFIDDWNKTHPKLKIIGVLGLNTLANWAVGLDFVSHTMGWWKGGKLLPEYARSFNSLICLPDDTNGYVVVLPGASATINNKVISNPAMAAYIPQSLPYYTKEEGGYYYVRAALDGIPTEMMLDTGSASSSVSEAVGAKFHPLYSVATQVLGADSLANATGLILRSLKLGNTSFDFPSVTIIHPPKNGGRSFMKDDEAVLGIDILTKCRIIMDFPGKTLYVSPYASSPHTLANTLQRLGMIMRARHNSHETAALFTGYIAALYAGYPAAKAGLQVEDEVIDINGQRVDKWMIDPNRVLLDKSLTIRVQRKGTAKPLTFTLTVPDH